MVMRFKEFIIEPIALSEAAMIASGSMSVRHVEKYLTPDHIRKLKYAMAKDSGGANKGEQVTVKKVVYNPDDDKMHAHIQHSGGKAVVPINHLMKPSIGRAGKGSEEKEDAAVDHLHKQIQEAVKANGGKPIHIRHNDKSYHVTGARKVVSGDYKGSKPKADIILHNNGKSQVFLSHKAGAAATSAQNYEGLSKHVGHEHVDSFINDLKSKHPRGLRSGHSYIRRLSTRSEAGKKFQRAVMFGQHHDSGEYGIHNVNSIEHGAVTLRKHPSGHYELVSDKSICNDKTFNHAEHPLEFTASFRNERRDHGIENARIGVAKVGSRPSSKRL